MCGERSSLRYNSSPFNNASDIRLYITYADVETPLNKPIIFMELYFKVMVRLEHFT